jgi:hypothetical protein
MFRSRAAFAPKGSGGMSSLLTRYWWALVLLLWAGGMYFLFARSASWGGTRGSSSPFGDASPPSPSRPRILVMTSSNCGEFTPKRWLSHAHEHGTLYTLVLFDYSADNACKGVVEEGPHTKVVHRPRTYKWPAVWHMVHEPGWGERLLVTHDFFLLTDDDIDIPGDAKGIERLVRYCAAAQMYICQPALSGKSAVNMDITVYTPGPHHARVTGFVEQMAPVFSRDALMANLPYFEHLTHGWGIDALWSDAAYAVQGRRVGVIDAVAIDHMRPSGVSALYKRVGGIEKAEAERADFKKKYRISEDVFALMANGEEAGNTGKGERLTVEGVEE